jgi:hypothetical protein
MTEAAKTPRVTYLVNQDGEVVKVAADDAQSLVDSGYLAASEKQVHDARLQEKHGSFGQQVATGAEAAGEALTLGGSDYLERALGVSPEDIAGREEANPTVHAVGTVAGTVAPLVLSGGTSALAEGAQLTAPSLVARLGTAVRGGAEAALPAATSTLGRMATRGVASALGAATEGAFYGVGQVVHEKALGNPNLTAQQALSEVGLSAALGGGLGFGLGAAEVGLPALLTKAKEAVSAGFGKAEAGLKSLYRAGEGVTGTGGDTAAFMVEHSLELSGLEQALPGIREDVANATPEMAEWLTRNGTRLEGLEKAFPGTTRTLARTSPEMAEELATNWPKIVTDPKARIRMATNVREGMQGTLDSVNAVLKRVNTHFAAAEEEALLAGADGGAAMEAYAKATDAVGKAASAMRAEPELHANGYAATLEKVHEGLVRDVEASGSPVEAFRRLKTLRQQLKETIVWQKGAPALQDVTRRNTNNALLDLYHSVGDTLKDEAVFGAQAARKAALDEAQSEWLKLTGKNGAFRKAFLEADGTVGAKRVNSWVNALGTDPGLKAAEAWGQLHEAAKRVVREAEASAQHLPTANFDAEALNALHEKTAGMVQEAREAGAAGASMKYLQNGGVGIPNSGPVVPGVVRHAETAAGYLPGPLRGAVKATVNLGKKLTSVSTGVAVLAGLQRAGTAVSRQVDRAAAALVRGGEVASHLGAARGAREVHASFEARAAQLQRLAATPEAMEETLQKAAAGLHPHAPDTAQALQLAQTRALSMLLAALPKPEKQGPMGPTLKPTVEAVAKFNRLDSALEKPLSLLHHAANGTLTPDRVAAVRQAYPELYQHMVEAVLTAAAGHKASPPYRNRLMLGTLLGQPVDATASGKAIAGNQAVYARPSARPDAMAGPGAMGRTTQTGLGKLHVADSFRLPGQASEARMRGGSH